MIFKIKFKIIDQILELLFLIAPCWLADNKLIVHCCFRFTRLGKVKKVKMLNKRRSQNGDLHAMRILHRQ